MDVIREKSGIIFPQLIFVLQACNVSNNETMHCLTPAFQVDPDFSEYRDGFIPLQYGFILDTVYRNDTQEEHQFHLYPNPHYEQFEEKTKKYKSDYLTINVRT